MTMHTCTRLVRANVGFNDYFTGEFLPDFDLKNMISTNTKDFSWKKSPKFAKF
jgi:hypothetical protein